MIDSVIRSVAVASAFLGCLVFSGSGGSRAAETAAAEVPRKVLTFYYPWYGNPNVPGGSGRWSHWSGVDEASRAIQSSTNYPELGAYDSHDPKLIAQHCKWSQQAGVDGWIVSWWGHGTFEDRTMQRILDACAEAELGVTIYYETVPGTKNAASAANDLLRVLERYAEHPAWLRVGDRPVLFVYGRAIGEIGLPGWRDAVAQLTQRRQPQALVIGDRISRQAAEVFDGLHTYNTAGALRGKSVDEVKQWAQQTYPQWVQTAKQAGRISTITVIPGYDDTKIRTPGLRVERFDGESYRAQWQAAIEADPDWILVTSWNEWHEGSEIEPSVELGDQYLKLTGEFARKFKGR